ncbi:MAG: NAD(P)-dependent oxidoreductase [Hyphomicrobiales bacterium]|nr:NAD(P)-dependent oxidoreductase [Hyphomicrobiales bacterium]
MGKRTTFIGLGVMGYPMAGHLKAAGHEVTVYNRTRGKADAWVAEHSGSAADTPAEAARGADFIFTCVGNDDDVRSVVLGETGAFAGMHTGAFLIDHTTASAKLARALAEEASKRGLKFLDAPVSGGQSGAEAGQLSIMVGGAEADFAEAQPVMDAYAKAMTLVGPAGSGQLTKMVNQICLGGLTQALAEALAFAQHAGLDTGQVLAAISNGAAQSWMMDHRAQTMIEDRFDFGFAVNWLRKDLNIALDEARSNGASLPATALIDQFYAEIQRRDGGRWDITSLIRLLRS